MIVTGEGGSGKTRLLLEWCKRMRAKHWLAGFVNMAEDLRPAALGETPRLLVIDYADTQTDGTDIARYSDGVNPITFVWSATTARIFRI